MLYIKLLLTAFFWGGTFIAGRLLSQTMSPYSAAFLRFLAAGLLLLGLIRIKEGRFPSLRKNQLFLILTLGLTGVVLYNIFFFTGLRLVSAGRASLIIALNPVVISLFSAIFFREKLSLLNLAGIGLSFAGAAVVVSNGDWSSLLTGSISRGDLFILGCVLCWSTYSVLGKTAMKTLSPLVCVGYSAIAGAAGLAIPASFSGLWREIGFYSASDWTAILFLGVLGTVVAFLWYYEAIRRIGPAKTAVFINFVPLAAIILAFFILDESITPVLSLGAVLVIGGVFLTNSTRKALPS